MKKIALLLFLVLTACLLAQDKSDTKSNLASLDSNLVCGVGAPAKNAISENDKWRSAFMAGFFVSIRDAKKPISIDSVKIDGKVKETIIVYNHKFGDFEIKSRTLVRDFMTVFDIIEVTYQSKTYIVKDYILSDLSVIADFPSIHSFAKEDLPKPLGGVEIKEIKYYEDGSAEVIIKLQPQN